MTKREAILQAILAVLETVSGVSSGNVYRTSVQAFLRSESPSLFLTWTRDSAEQRTFPYLDWNLQFRVMVLARGDEPDSVADAIVADLHSKIMADPTLGGLCIDIRPAFSDLQVIDADKDAGIVGSEFVAFYRTQIQDLTTT